VTTATQGRALEPAPGWCCIARYNFGKGKNVGKKPPERVRRASEANDAVERILSETQQLWEELGKIPQGQENAVRVRRGDMPVWPVQLERALGFGGLAHVMDRVVRYSIVDMWRKQGRVAYDLHPEIAAQLYRTDLKGKMPGGLFHRISHINPMIPLPRPWPFKEKNREGLIRGYFLTGRTGTAICTTTDKRSEGLMLSAWIEFPDRTTGEIETVTPFFALPDMGEDPFTFDDVLQATHAWHDQEITAEDRKLIKQIVPGALSILTYLCCDNRDVQEPPPERPNAKRKQAPPRDPYYVRVGWKIGPKLHANRMRVQGRTRDGVSFPSGIEQEPQHRAGHYKVIHHGPRKSLWSLKWVDPYWTKLDLLEEGKEPVTSVVPVDAQRRDPAGHRDVRLANLGTEKAKEIRDRERQQAREERWSW
jgi:hypothetical protein